MRSGKGLKTGKCGKVIFSWGYQLVLLHFGHWVRFGIIYFYIGQVLTVTGLGHRQCFSKSGISVYVYLVSFVHPWLPIHTCRTWTCYCSFWAYPCVVCYGLVGVLFRISRYSPLEYQNLLGGSLMFVWVNKSGSPLLWFRRLLDPPSIIAPHLSHVIFNWYNYWDFV